MPQISAEDPRVPAPPAPTAADSQRHGRRLPDTGMRERIKQAFVEVLDRKPYAEVTVADILPRAGVSRTSFYFYFSSLSDLLRDVASDTVSELVGTVRTKRPAAPADTSTPATADAAVEETPTTTWIVQSGRDVADFWRTHGAIYRAIVDGAGMDEGVRRTWREQTEYMVQVVMSLSEEDPESVRWFEGRDPRPTVLAMTALSERLYYMAAGGEGPFDDEETLVSTLADIWSLALLGHRV